MKTISIPHDRDADFIRRMAGVQTWSIYQEDGAMVMAYEDERESDLQVVLSEYDDLYLPYLTALILKEASEERDRRVLAFSFNGLPIELDATAKSNITGAVAGLERDPSMMSITWSLGGGEFIVLPREAIFALGRAAFAHMESCFAAHKRVADAIKAVPTLIELREFHVPSHFGWNQPTL